MAAGPGISPRAPGAPRGSGRSARNYPHLVAERLNLDLVDVTYSGATTAAVLTDYQRGAPPQICALDGSEALVTVTIGGNDVGYIPLLIVASLPNFARRLPMLRGWVADLLDRDARDRALATVFDSLCEVGRSIRKRSPNARVLFVDYLTLLPPAGVGAPPLSEDDAALGRHVAETLERLTAEAAVETGCEIVRAAAASRDHHAWSVQPWAEKTGRLARYVVPLPGRPAPLHPNEAGMHAVARAITAQWGR